MSQRFHPALAGRVSRRTVALHPVVWATVAACFAAIAITCAAIALFVAPFQGWEVGAVGAALFVVAAILASQPPPEADTWLPHFAVAAVYLCTTGAMFAFEPQGGTALPAVMFMGPVAAVWLDKPRHWLPHMVLAPILLTSPVWLGHADQSTFISACTIVGPTFVLGLCVRTVLLLAAGQSRRLEHLAMRDPLTGAGNRRMLDEAFASELARHAAIRRPLTVFAFDLNGFKTINDTLGHAAGDRVLRDVATRLAALADERATVCRLGGDEFVVIAPLTGRTTAEALGEAFRAGLGPAITAGLGWATYPHDGTEPDRLLEIADARLIARKAAARDTDDLADASWIQGIVLPDTVEEPSVAEGAPAPRRPRRPLSRDVLGTGRLLWRITGLMFIFYAAIALAFIAAGPHPGEPLSNALSLPLALVGVLIGTVILCTRPPALHTWGSELAVACTYLVPVAAFLVNRPDASALIGFGIFVGPLVAVRTRTRRRTLVHLGAALLSFSAVCASGLVNVSSIIAIGLLALTTIVMTFYCVFVLEAMEAQGAELERLSALDPLTLLANRRRLGEGLAEALEEAAVMQEPVAVLALDLNGFKHLNDTVGHGAGDLLLIEVATQLRHVVGRNALVARPGGDEFTIVLEGHDAEAAAVAADRVRAAVGVLNPSGCRITTGVGIALYPVDGRTPDALLAAADARLIDDKYGHGRTSTAQRPAA
ncbi:MAG: diguanylate cyclase [Patulibacter minatonensis]